MLAARQSHCNSVADNINFCWVQVSDLAGPAVHLTVWLIVGVVSRLGTLAVFNKNRRVLIEKPCKLGGGMLRMKPLISMGAYHSFSLSLKRPHGLVVGVGRVRYHSAVTISPSQGRKGNLKLSKLIF